MATESADLAAALTGYALRMHAAAGDSHHVLSPLGAWLLLALAGQASTGSLRIELEDVLGVDADSAAAYAQGLLASPHPEVSSAAAVWSVPAATSDPFVKWLSRLPATVETGGLPSQAQADTWASDNTKGLITKFPLDLDRAVLVLASALATRISWASPFELAPAAELGRGSQWATSGRRVLESSSLHRSAIASTGAGDVCVHWVGSYDGITVFSVIADAGVPAPHVLAAAYEIACSPQSIRRRSLFDLFLGSTAIWTIAEEEMLSGGTSPSEHLSAVLPAWSATTTHDLMRSTYLGFDTAARALVTLLPPADYTLKAVQSAVARYSRYGFEAAAVTGLAALVGFVQPTRVIGRTARLRFAHPFAVVATATSHPRDDPDRFWNQLPVFSAWVTEVEDAA